MLGFWFGPVIVKNQQVAGTLGWWDPESYDCGSFVECRECRPTIMPHSPPFYRKLQMVHTRIDVSFYQPNVRGFLCNWWWLWLSTTDQCCVSIDIIAKFSAIPQCPQINNGRLFLFLAWRGRRYCDHSFVKDWAESGRGMSHGCVWPIQKCLDICTILYPQFDGFFLLFCTVAHCCTIVLVLLPNLNCRCFENGNLIHGSHWKLHVSPWCSSSFSLSALLAWHTGKKTFFSCRSLLLFGHVRGFSGRVHQVKHGGNHEISPNKGQVRKHCQKNRWYSSCHRVGIFTIIYLPRPGLL